MSNTKQRKPRFVTPAGIAIYPHLIEPDTKFNTDGTYQTELGLPLDAEVFDAKGRSLGTFQDFLDVENHKAYEEACERFAGKKDKKGKPVVVVEADAPYRIDDDKLIPKFKLNAVVRPKEGKPFTQKPVIFDAKGKPTELESLWGGSVIKVSFEVNPYCVEGTKQAGVSLRLKAVQVLELRRGGGANAENYGFGEEEGYEAEDEAGDAGFAEEEGYSEDSESYGDF